MYRISISMTNATHVFIALEAIQTQQREIQQEISYTTYSLLEIGRSLGGKSMSSDGMQFAVKIYLLPSETLYIIVPVIGPSYTHARNAERLESGYGLEVISS